MWCAGPAALMAFCPGLWVSNPRSAHGLGADCEGATEDAARKSLSEVTRPMSVHMPAMKICEKLKKMDSQICELRYGIMESGVFFQYVQEKKLDLESLDLSKMRVAELKQILYSWEECRACVEKTDYVNLTKELAPKYAVTHPTTEL